MNGCFILLTIASASVKFATFLNNNSRFIFTMCAEFKELVVASGLSQSKVADFLCTKSAQMVTERDIRAWSALPGLKSSRKCPAWALKEMSAFAPQAQQAA